MRTERLSRGFLSPRPHSTTLFKTLSPASLSCDGHRCQPRARVMARCAQTPPARSSHLRVRAQNADGLLSATSARLQLCSCSGSLRSHRSVQGQAAREDCKPSRAGAPPSSLSRARGAGVRTVCGPGTSCSMIAKPHQTLSVSNPPKPAPRELVLASPFRRY